jgi:hypothetical protein
MHFTCIISVSQWRLTIVYGEAQTTECHRTWDMMKNICGLSQFPWLCIGDFNEVLHADEHEGVGHHTHNQIQGFRDAVDVCSLIDLGYKGHFWTWEKKVAGGTFTRVRLDRALGSAEWAAQFPLASVSHEEVATSNHCALLLQLEEGMTARPCKPTFIYETMWDRHEGLKPTVEL